jgi:aldehyde dehydrogenase (NAD+)
MASMTTTERVLEARMTIGGRQVAAADGRTLDVIDPSTGAVFASVPHGGREDIDAAVASARAAFESGPWPAMTPAERGRVLHRIAAAILAHADELALLESRDVGKPLREARADVAIAARYFEFFAGIADKIHGETIPLGPGKLDYTVREPIGVSGQIIPFNYPLQNISRGSAPALAAGCTVVLKPSEEAPLTPLRVAELALEAGLPAGVLNVVPGDGTTGAALANHAGIDQITFTGSVATGIKVAQAAAANVVPSVVELGGKSPAVVLADADLDRTVAGIATSIFTNAGQTCSACTRLLVEPAIREPLLERLVARARSLRLGPGPADPDLGPLVAARQRDRVEGYLELAREDGVQVLSGGGRPQDPGLNGGFFIEPTILAAPSNDVRVAQEEIFGPVLTAIEVQDLDDAARIANATPYGLSATIWTRDIDKAMDLAARIRSGQVYVNTAIGGVELPFGGYKASGWGREKGLEALRGYTQVKNVCIAYGGTSMLP